MAQVVVALQNAACRLVARESLSFPVSEVRGLFAKTSHGQALQFLEVDVANGGQHHLLCAVVVRHEVKDVLAHEPFYQLRGSQNVARQRMPFEDHLLIKVVDLVGGRIQVGVDFVQDDFLLLVQLVFGESGAEGDVGEEVDGSLVMLLQKRGLDAGLLLGGEGVEVAAHIVQTTQDMVGFAVLGAFENGVLHKVGEAVLMGLLVAGAGFHHQDEMGDLALFLSVYQSNAVGKDGFSIFFLHSVVKIGCKDTIIFYLCGRNTKC